MSRFFKALVVLILTQTFHANSAITASQRSELIALTIAFTGRGPTSGELAQMTAKIESGETMGALANSLATTPLVLQTYPSIATSSEKATILINNVLNRAPTAWEMNYIVGRLSNGLSLGQLIYDVARAVLVSTDPANKIFKNKIEVATHYAENKGGQDAETAQEILAEVTGDPATVTAAIAKLDGKSSNVCTATS